MKTDPTASVAGTPLSYQAVTSGNQAARQSQLKSKPKIAISDLVETSDREGDGRQQLENLDRSDSATNSTNHSAANSAQDNPTDESGGLLDLTG
jgi:hypothetical protein